jgi:DNA-binding GntR family transcriptional regulator
MRGKEKLMAVLLRDRVYRVIRQAILTCEFMPGEDLREQVLADKYHVSRSPVRDVLLRLERESLVTVLPRQGYRVNPISIRDVEDIFGLRAYIEPACAAAASRSSDDAVRTLDQFRSFTGNEAYDGANLDYNRALHQTIADLAGNSRLAAAEYKLIEEFDRLVRLSFRPSDAELIACTVSQHLAIIEAIQAHDADAAYRVSAHHVECAKARIIEPLRSAAEVQDVPSQGIDSERD